MFRPSALARACVFASRPAATVRPRSGTIYVAVLGVAIIVALIGLTTLHLSRTELDVLLGVDHMARAELLAQSAVELAIERIDADSNWRTTFTSGAEVPPDSWTTLGTGGSFKFVLVDNDGSLADNSADPLTIRGIGRYGDATQVTTVDLEPSGDALDCLDASLHVGGNLVFTGGSTSTDQMVSSNSSITVSSGTVNGNAWAVGTITGSITPGLPGSGQSPARAMPEAASLTTGVWRYYLANGTRISMSAIPSGVIDRVVISSASNPYGVTNPQGIYVIDCQNQQLHIRDSRIQATLVVINQSAATVIENTIHWEPPAANFPALMVQGDLTMAWSGGTPLDESTANVNFNPAGTPYASETDYDNDKLDSYPGVIMGLVFASGNFSASTACVLDGAVVAGGTGAIGANLTMTYDNTPANFPPPGFGRDDPMRVIPATWQRVAR
jgi:hypothetical protein